jgi:hypothetical protein
MRLALHAEWTKLRTQPGMAALLIGAVVLTVGLSTGVAATATTASASDPAKLALTGVYLGQVVVAALSVLVIGGEYSTGMIRTTLGAMPRLTPDRASAVGRHRCGVRVAEGERVWSLAVLADEGNALHRLRRGGEVAGGHPPHRQVVLGQSLEPLAAAAEHLQVVAPVGEVLQRLDRLPDREIDQHHVVVVVGAQARGVRAALVDQTPDEARRTVGQGVDLGELGYEVGQDGAVERGEDASDVHLGEMEVSHGDSMAGSTF